MKFAFILLLFVFTCNLPLFAQHKVAIQWQRTIGTSNQERFDEIVNDSRNVVTACSDGGYAIAVLRPSNPASPCNSSTWTGEHLWLIKFNKFGVTEWEKCYGGQFSNYWMYVNPGGLIQTADSGFVIVGGTNFNDGDFITNHGSYDAFVIKTSASGAKEWSRCYGGTEAEGFSSVVQDYDGNYVVAGEVRSNNGDVVGIHWYGSSGTDAWIVKISPTGNIIWQKCIDYSWGNERFSSVKMGTDSSFVAVGLISAKVSKSGTLLWQRSEESFDVVLDSYNYVYSTKREQSYAQVRKVSPAGTLMWTKELFPGVTGAVAISLQMPDDTSLVVVGKTNAQAHSFYGLHGGYQSWSYDDIFFAQIDSAANVKMLKCFGGTAMDIPVHLTPTPDKGYLMLGLSQSNDGDVLQNLGNVDYWLAKIGSFNTVKGKMFFDYNNNALQDVGEDAFTNTFVTSVKNGSVNGVYSNDGTFSYTVDTGALVAKPVLNQPYYTINPASLNTSHLTYGHTDSVIFAIIPIPGITDLAVSLGTQNPQRPGFTNKLYLVLTNNGTKVIQNAFVSILPDTRTTIIAHDSIGFSRSLDTLTWQFNNLEPRNSKTVTISIRNAAPPVLNIGNPLFHFVQARPFANDSSDYDNRDTIVQYMVGSFDPNNKLDDVGGILYKDRYMNGDKFLYTINFQNTGTDTAFTVAIRDTLSSLYNMQSLEMIGSSHPYTMTIAGNRLQWTFSDILLVDSVTNEPKSHGYVMFRIKPRTGLNVNQVLSNTAAIYFDYNLPVITNRNDVKITLRPGGTFPVNITGIKATNQNGNVQVEWNVSNESNIARYDVEHSTNGFNFRRFTATPAVNTETAHTYNALHTSPNKRGNYYRVKAIGLNGEVTYTNIVKVDIGKEISTGIAVYPNPIKGNIINVGMNGFDKGTYHLSVYNSSGKLVAGKAIQITDAGQSSIENLSLPPAMAKGVYQVKITGVGTASRYMQQFIIE